MDDEIVWKIIDKFFKDNPLHLSSHHLDSYNSFFNVGIKQIIREKNPIHIMKEPNENTGMFEMRCEIFIGGRNADKIYFGKPVIYDETRNHFMFPNEARLRNMTYGITIHYDIEVDFYIMDEKSNKVSKITQEYPNILLGRFPIMLHSNLCVLNGIDKNTRFQMGECKNDPGGYFIIDGKEKCILSQEKFADNMLYIKEMKKGPTNVYSHSAEIRSVSEDASKPTRTFAIKLVAPDTTRKNNYITVVIPNVRKPVPLFVVMRALGIESDKDIIEACLLDIIKHDKYIDLFIPSIYDAGPIFDQHTAIKYIATLTKGKTTSHAIEVLTDYLLPHIGEMNFRDKAFFIGHMVKNLLQVFTKDKASTDRDSFSYKRIEVSGSLLYDLFREYYTIQQHSLFKRFDSEYFYKKETYQGERFINLIGENYKEFFNLERVVEDGFRKAFKGNWGAQSHTKRTGIVQDVNRLSYNSFISHLRKTNLPMDPSAKTIKPRLAHTTHWGMIDPIDTPDGGNVGLHKTLAIMAGVTSGYSAKPLIELLRTQFDMILISESTAFMMEYNSKIFVNGNWIGCIKLPKECVQRLKEMRRIALIPIYTSIRWDIKNNIILIYTDSGRIYRPLFYINDNVSPSYSSDVIDKIKNNEFTWSQLIAGFGDFKNVGFDYKQCVVYDKYSSLYSSNALQTHSPCVLDLLDTSETDGALIGMGYKQRDGRMGHYTHVELHPSLIFGTGGVQVMFPENNQLPRNVFACGQARQSVSLYHSNFGVRVDKTGVILNNGQVPLIKSRFLKHINNEEHPYGENTIVAIMCFNGYNVEDSILFNAGSLHRGLFRTTYYNVYESREDSASVNKTESGTKFANIENMDVLKMSPDCDYSKLNTYGLIEENQPVTDKTVLIGKVEESSPSLSTSTTASNKTFNDMSILPKKGQTGFVDKSFMTESEEGFRLAKVKVRSERMPDIGDKFASRHGQKGTLGIVIPEEDMPFTSDGVRPDIIINPHAIPSRMTIGQLIETIMSKVCVNLGGYGDGTAFINQGDTVNFFGKLLQNSGYNSAGNEILYNGQTGEQIESSIFIGPTYYMRLKHMVKDKINYRAQGPRTMLTRQTVQGRANDGGLKIGEMERDGLIAHGVNAFIKESMLVRGDDYYMAVCNNNGTIAIYNETRNLFLSPYIDGPIKYSGIFEENMSMDTRSKYGHSFSIVRIPYSFKLLIQELITMNISLRLITEDNIEQMTSVLFAKKSINLDLKGADERVGLDSSMETMMERTVPTPMPLLESARPLENIASAKNIDFKRTLPIITSNNGEFAEYSVFPDVNDGQLSKRLYSSTFIISSKKEMRGLDYTTLRQGLINLGLVEISDPTTTPYVLWMEQLDNNKFDAKYYKTQCFIMNILNDEKTRITDKSNLYFNFNKEYPEACKKYMAQTWELNDFLRDNVFSQSKNKAFIVRPVGKGAFSGKDIIRFDDAAKLEEARKLYINKDGTSKYDSVIVSEYITNPMLYTGRKFHLRTYFLISTISGKYKTYFYNIYELFTAKNPYNNINYADKDVHDTHFASTAGDILCPRDLDPTLKNVFATQIYPKMEDCMSYISKLMEGHTNPYEQSENAFEVFGCDFLVKDNYDVVLMEINDKTGFTMNSIENKKTFSAIYLGVINNMIKASLWPAYNTRQKTIRENETITEMPTMVAEVEELPSLLIPDEPEVLQESGKDDVGKNEDKDDGERTELSRTKKIVMTTI